jgi:glycolate dehydrogenase FAD-binding subunit
MTTTTLLEIAANVVGRDAARPGMPADAVEGIVPQLVVEPASAEAVGSTLEWASRDRLAVLTRGSGTKLGWGPTPQAIDLLLSTSRLNRVVAHRHGDLTATVQSGATLAGVNGVLAQHRQWIPLDAPVGDRATIGGLVATNDSGPRRHRYGGPRDLIIGVEFARADGRLAKGGGIVVKNVAGYDLPRFMTGSFGSLAVIVAATFKLYPLTQSSRTVVVDLQSPGDLGTLTGKILASYLTPTAMEFQTPPLRLLIRFESIEASVEEQATHAAKLIGESAFSARIISGAEEDHLWTQHGQRVWQTQQGQVLGGVPLQPDRLWQEPEADALIKVNVLPTELAETLSLLSRLSGTDGYAAAGRAGLGVFLARIGGDAELQKRVISGLRGVLPAGRGSVVIRHASPKLKAEVDVWGPIGDGLPLMRSVKQQFDPAEILNRGRGPGGI